MKFSAPLLLGSALAMNNRRKCSLKIVNNYNKPEPITYGPAAEFIAKKFPQYLTLSGAIEPNTSSDNTSSSSEKYIISGSYIDHYSNNNRLINCNPNINIALTNSYNPCIIRNNLIGSYTHDNSNTLCKLTGESSKKDELYQVAKTMASDVLLSSLKDQDKTELISLLEKILKYADVDDDKKCEALNVLKKAKKYLNHVRQEIDRLASQDAGVKDARAKKYEVDNKEFMHFASADDPRGSVAERGDHIRRKQRESKDAAYTELRRAFNRASAEIAENFSCSVVKGLKSIFEKITNESSQQSTLIKND